MKKIFLAVISLLAALYCGCMVYYQLNSYDSLTGLYEESNLMLICNLLLLLTIAAVVIFSVLTIKKTTKSSKDSNEASSLTRVHQLVRRNYKKGQFVFLVVSWMIFLSSTVFRFVVFIKEASTFHIILSILSVGLLWGIARFLLINLLDQTKSTDSFVLLLPTVYAAVFAIYRYRQLAIVPQLSIYYVEILAMLLSLLTFFSFSSHYFGRGGNRIALCIALSMTVCGAGAYLCGISSFIRDMITESISADVSTFETMSQLLYYAASALFGGGYCSILLSNSRKSIPIN